MQMSDYLQGFNMNLQEDGLPDTSETIHISSLALLKMMKHGRAGIPLEVMGLMLGEIIDEYNIVVIDVFSMPQSGSGIAVEAVDPVFQTEMLEILKTTGRMESVVGWYHSHPGFGCWLSSTDVATQSEFERLSKKAVAVVIDPIQSVKGKVVIDAFRNIPQLSLEEPRITTSNIGFLKKPSIVSIIHGLNQKYYSFNIKFISDKLEQNMLLNLNKKSWSDTLKPKEPENKNLSTLLENYSDGEIENRKLNKEERELKSIGKINYKRRIEAKCEEIIDEQVFNQLLCSIHNYIFR